MKNFSQFWNTYALIAIGLVSILFFGAIAPLVWLTTIGQGMIIGGIFLAGLVMFCGFCEATESNAREHERRFKLALNNLPHEKNCLNNRQELYTSSTRFNRAA